ncbi:hypothetical protein WL88_25735 [Burkholderia diffusa]|uniref:Uncharacterized protein n=1 Tax=Burkholderia diffusa TaxID=488732 RepID=A0AAW3PB75_9BURK|nr:hypothetical protein WL86_29755 [Burkholderia diffusa]KWF38671.1 hypothetical protein WL85_10920 [Burkholderia diffusa]KWF46716.1 hypothetical protein WL88_25735 [Burkholderia diffusa]KWF50712.1 hypothetical protein WL87_16185 [Burkholderia diffusa]
MLCSLQKPSLRVTCPQRIFCLQNTHPLYGMRATKGLRTGFRKAEMLNFPLIYQILYGACDVFDRYRRIKAMLIKQVDTVAVQPLERRFRNFPDVIGATVQANDLVVTNVESEFRCNDDMVAERRQGFANQFLVEKWAACFRGVKKRNATLISTTYNVYLLVTT